VKDAKKGKNPGAESGRFMVRQTKKQEKGVYHAKSR
jgi:hypothetical protein